jgi:DNA primase
VHDLYGNIVGISGRATRQGDNPKYLFYNGRHIVNGKENLGELGEWYPGYTNEGVRDHLWRMDKCYQRLNEVNDGQLIIVEGFKAALWLVQHGWINTVALMGARISPAQERIVRSLGCTVFVLLDNNYPGISGAKKVCQRLAVSTFPVYRCKYPSRCDDSAQPDDLDDQELESVLSNAKRVGGVKNVRSSRVQLRFQREHRVRPGVRTPEFLR